MPWCPVWDWNPSLGDFSGRLRGQEGVPAPLPQLNISPQPAAAARGLFMSRAELQALLAVKELPLRTP